MAACRKLGMGLVAAAVAVVILQASMVSGARRPGKLKSASTCATADEYVYPYWSLCSAPAALVTPYYYIAVTSGLGGLEPEWDESNSTYYVRLVGDSSSEGAKYEVAVDASSASTDNLLVNSSVYIYNADSGRALQWRQEGTDEFFLIEQEVSSITEGAAFRFLAAESVSLPCPLIYPPAQCGAYYLISDPASSTYTDAGFLAYEDEDATYVKAAPSGSVGDLPLLVIRPSTLKSAMPVPTKIRSVTA